MSLTVLKNVTMPWQDLRVWDWDPHNELPGHLISKLAFQIGYVISIAFTSAVVLSFAYSRPGTGKSGGRRSPQSLLASKGQGLHTVSSSFEKNVCLQNTAPIWSLAAMGMMLS